MTEDSLIDGLRCPACGHDSHFYITTTVRAEVWPDGADVADGCDLHWDDGSLTICPECSRDGEVREFRAAGAA